MKLTTKQAWLEIARIFEKVSRKRVRPRRGEAGRYGLCDALAHLGSNDRITLQQEAAMERQMYAFAPQPDDAAYTGDMYWWPLNAFDGGVEPRWVGNKAAKDRATFAALMAEVVE